MGLLQKLQIKDPNQFLVVDCPKDLLEICEQEGLVRQVNIDQYSTGGVLLFVRNSEDLNEVITDFLKDATADNHWVAFPKKTSNIPTDLGRDQGWDKLTEADWIPVRQISINDQWSALRFRPRANVKEIKRGTDYPGIDSKQKTVAVPAVLDNRLKKEGLKAPFEALSFTKRKEAVISILEAKKPETLERRIQKIIEALIN